MKKRVLKKWVVYLLVVISVSALMLSAGEVENNQFLFSAINLMISLTTGYIALKNERAIKC